MKRQSFSQLVEQAANLAAFNAAPEACKCERTEIRERAIRGGSKQFVRQCLDCGESVGSPVKQFGDVAPFDEGLRQRSLQERTELRERVKKAESAEWWANYHAYMAGDDWKRRRAKVLERDEHLCQGCLSAKATEVHHLSYENFTREFAFELVSLCHACHERYHDDE